MKKSFTIVGILNTTPDSYVDGGRFVTVEKAVAQAKKFLQEGADIIEIGGESTGPNSQDVPAAEELRRTIPAIHAIRAQVPQAQVSIDTYKAEVAQTALQAGVVMVNDVTAGRGDPNLFSTVAKSKARLVLMHSKDETPRTTVQKALLHNSPSRTTIPPYPSC